MNEEKEITQEVEKKVNEENINNQNQEIKNMYEKIDIDNIDVLVNKSNENSSQFAKHYNKIKKISSLVMILCMTLVLVLLFVFGNNGAFIGIAIALVVLYFIAIMVFSKKVKTKLNEESLNIVKDYFINLDSYILNDENIKEAKFNYDVKLPEDTFKNLKICKDICHVGGRDFITGYYKNVSFIAGDNLVKTNETKEDGTKQEYVVFLGKLFVFNVSLLREGRALIYLKGKGANGPTDIEGLELKEGVLSEKFAVYANTDVTELISSIKEQLERFEISDLLLDMFISITEDKIGFGFSYVDSVMSVPLLDPVKKEDLLQYKNDTDIMFSIMDILVK